MDSSALTSIRNIGIIAHIDAGKTTTTERILYYTGEVHRMGDVDKGNTTTDYLTEERERGITIVAAAITCRWKDAEGKPLTINIIDTPGHVDFTAEVERSLRVLDGAVVVFSAVEGVEAQSETVWRQASKYSVPRLCFINKMDRIGAEFDRVYGEITDRLEGHPIPLQIPIGAGPEGTMGEFKGLVDLITMKAQYYKTEDLGSTITEAEIPDDIRPDAELWRERMIERPRPISMSTFTERYMAHLEGERTHRGRHRRRPASRHPHRPRPASSLWIKLQVRRCSTAPRCRRRLPPQPARPPPRHRPPPQEGDRPRPPSRPGRTLLRPGLQDHQRRPRRPLVRPDLFSGEPQGRHPRLQPRQGQERDLLASLSHPRRRTRQDRGDLRRGHRRRRRPERLGHRRHPLRRLAPDLAGEDRIPRDGHQHVDRAGFSSAGQGEARRHPRRRSPARTPPSPTRSTRRRARPSSRAWASSTWRSSRTG